jgi:two-component system, OmpR family, sensor histidine kinase CpxA
VRSLFAKIFVSYWLAQALFLVLAILVTMAVREPQNSTVGLSEERVLGEGVRIYEQSGKEAVHRYMEEVRESEHVRGFLLDEHKEEITGRKLPDWLRDVEHGRIHPPQTFLGQWLAPFRVHRQSTISKTSGHRYVLIAVLPPTGPFGPNGVPGLGILIAVISSGLVCYLLTRYLTAPVVRLRAATLKLAAGDLSARAGTRGLRRRDEMADLVRDFDAMAERLEKLVTAQSRLLNDISHELRSPLARMNVALGLARQRTGPEAQSALERIDLESNRLNALIERLLTIARLECGYEAIRKDPLRLEELVREIAEDADFEAQCRDCHVRPVIQDDCLVMGNPPLLHSAVENVVRNATRYTQEGTEVEVHLERGHGAAGGEAIIRVTDSGPGVPEDTLDKLFLPFYRIDDARGRLTGGVGLGLAITERAVRLHGGTVRAANRPQGGLVVEIRLPLAEAPVSPPPSGPEAVVGVSAHDERG